MPTSFLLTLPSPPTLHYKTPPDYVSLPFTVAANGIKADGKAPHFVLTIHKSFIPLISKKKSTHLPTDRPTRQAALPDNSQSAFTEIVGHEVYIEVAASTPSTWRSSVRGETRSPVQDHLAAERR